MQCEGKLKRSMFCAPRKMSKSHNLNLNCRSYFAASIETSITKLNNIHNLHIFSIQHTLVSNEIAKRPGLGLNGI